MSRRFNWPGGPPPLPEGGPDRESFWKDVEHVVEAEGLDLGMLNHATRFAAWTAEDIFEKAGVDKPTAVLLAKLLSAGFMAHLIVLMEKAK